MNIERINELARKKNLTDEEKAEQAQLRAEYIKAFRGSLKAQLDSIEYVEDLEKKEGE